MTDFTALGLAEPLLRALEVVGYTTPTPIQRDAIPALLENHDLLGVAQTGTGKTAAFTLPMLQKLDLTKGRLPRRAIRALVLAPTRELASQIEESIRDYGKFMRLTSRTAFGGVPIHRQIAALANGLDILVATPGRLIDLIEREAVFFDFVEFLVVDEADQMMDMGFIQPLRKIVSMLPKQRQTLFFSATMPKEIRALADSMLNDPVEVRVAPSATPAERIKQGVIHIDHGRKVALLRHLLDDTAVSRVIVFARTKHGADKVVKSLERMGVPSASIHGNRSQPQRERALDGFRRGAIRLLIATDIAARGIDIDNISHVINYDLPNVPETYVHRIGRTARAGAEGEAISFCTPDERPYLRQIEKTIRRKLDVIDNPLGDASAAEIAAARNDQPLRPEETLDGQDKAEREARTKTRDGRRSKDGGERSFGRPRSGGGAERGPRRERPQYAPRGGEGNDPFARSGNAYEGDARSMDHATEEHINSVVGEAIGDKSYGKRGPRSDAPRGERSHGDRSYGDRSYGDRPSRERSESRPFNRGPRPERSERSFDRAEPRGDSREWSPVARPAEDHRAPRGDRPFRERSSEGRPARPFGNRDERPARPFGNRDDRPARPFGNRDDRPARPYAERDERPQRSRDDRPFAGREGRPEGKRGPARDGGKPPFAKGGKPGGFGKGFGAKKKAGPAPTANRGRFQP